MSNILAKSLDTKRLHLLPLEVGDARALFSLFHNPEAMPYWHTLPHRSEIDTRLAIESMVSAPNAFWWSLRTTASPEQVIGFLGFLGRGAIPGFGYALNIEHRQCGYAVEAARAALDFGFGQLKHDRVELWIHEANGPSQRVAEKLGFARRGCFRQLYPREGISRETLTYGVTRSEWQKQSEIVDRTVRFYGIEPVLEVADVTAAAQFYRDKLGFTVEFMFGEPPSRAGLFCGEWTTQGLRLQLQRRRATSGTSSGYFYVQAGPQLEKLYEKFIDKGVPIADELASWPWGRREFAVRDLDGHILRFGEPG